MRARNMWKSVLLFICLSGYCCAGPLGAKRNMPIVQREDEPKIMEPEASDEMDAERPATTPEMMMMSTLTLPSNATSIRADITDGFSCENKTYGYYADVENDCQIFHVCLPVTYADGKENTFRWSFICPEETIFSQDSFTCMRPEDMTIDCEESSQYYELNRNFGMIDDDANKNNNNNLATKPALNEEPEDSRPQVQQQRPAQDEKVETAPVAPVESAQPMKQKEKPVKVQKPNRRKPGQSFGIQNKLPVSFPLRKMPQVSQHVAEVVVPQYVETVEQPEEKPEEVKPATKFSKRPVMASSIKEKIQSVKAEPTPIRAEMYNQNRKRPIYLNRKESVTSAPVEEVPAEVAEPEVPEAVEAEATLKSTVTLTAVPQATTAEADDMQVPAQASSDLQTSVVDVEPQASETAQVFAKPAETVEEAVAEEEEVESMAADKIQLKDATATNVNAEVEVEKNEESAVATDSEAPVSEILKEEEALPQPIEAFEEIPAVIVEMEETAKPNEVEVTAEKETAAETLAASPAIFEQNSEENSAPALTLEEMEDSKPADAAETMPATPQMEHPDSMVQEMFDMEDSHQTMGGFKPVDPAMAAEAEALITDFINSLRKTESGMFEEPQVSNLENQAAEISNEEQELSEVADSETDTQSEIEPAENANPEVEIALKKLEEMQVPEETVAAAEPEVSQEIENESEKMEATEVHEPISEAEAVAEVSESQEPESEMTNYSEPMQSVIDDTLKSEGETSNSEMDEQQLIGEEALPSTQNEAANNDYQLKTAEVTEPEKEPENENEPESESEMESEAEVPAPSAIMTKTVQEEEQQPQQAPEVAEPVESMMNNNFPTEMFQIPVQIIQTPVEEVHNMVKSAEKTPIAEATESQPESEVEPELESEQPKEPEMPTEQFNYAPISIDDIVELVKERLDQMPASEKGTPMQMVMQQSPNMEIVPAIRNSIQEEPMNQEMEPEAAEVANVAEVAEEADVAEAEAEAATDEEEAKVEGSKLVQEEEDKPEDSKVEEEIKEEAAEALVEEHQEIETIQQEEAEQEKEQQQQSEMEEIVMPIYHRVSEAEPIPNLLRTHLSAMAEDENVGEEASAAAESVPVIPAESEMVAEVPQAEAEEIMNASSAAVVQTEVENADKTEAVVEAEAEADAETAPMIMTKTEAEKKTETETETEQEMETKSEMDKETETEPETELNIETEGVNTKASRAYRARSISNAKMDPRKRRFLFRSDAR